MGRFPGFHSAFSLLFSAMLFFCCGGGSLTAAGANHPARFGVNIAGSWHMFNTDKLFYQHESWFQAAADLGVQFVDVNFLIKEAFTPTSMTQAQVTAQLQGIDTAMRAHGLQYTLSVELANWVATFGTSPGENLFDHPDGTHRWDLPMTWLGQVLPPLRAGAPALIGINLDEGEHNQLIGNAYVGVISGHPIYFDKPYYAVTDGTTMTAAFNKLRTQAQWLASTQYQGQLRLVSEQTWPDMFHIFAGAGWTVAPKLLKENFSSIVMAAALGSALQYQAQGADLWVCCDLWKMTQCPGWTPQALSSALLMAYWLGASGIYVENIDNIGTQPRAAGSSTSGTLIAWRDATHYSVTNHGARVRDFIKNYAPRNPRPFDWRDYRPRVAIVRLPDGGTGRPANAFRDRLLGNRLHPIDDASAEWLKVWPVLTHGAVLPSSISLNGPAYSDWQAIPFFVPLDSVAVFDHTVHGSVLDSVRCFVVCGEALSAQTWGELRTRAAAGATVIIARRLYNQFASGSLPGDWLLVDDFADPTVAQKLQPFLGPADVARFRFKDYMVEFRTGTDKDALTVSVISTKNAANPELLELR